MNEWGIRAYCDLTVVRSRYLHPSRDSSPANAWNTRSGGLATAGKTAGSRRPIANDGVSKRIAKKKTNNSKVLFNSPLGRRAVVYSSLYGILVSLVLCISHTHITRTLLHSLPKTAPRCIQPANDQAATAAGIRIRAEPSHASGPPLPYPQWSYAHAQFQCYIILPADREQACQRFSPSLASAHFAF